MTRQWHKKYDQLSEPKRLGICILLTTPFLILINLHSLPLIMMGTLYGIIILINRLYYFRYQIY